MAREGESIVRFAKEASWGEKATSGWITAIQEGEGFKFDDQIELYKLVTNSHWPYPRSQEPIKRAVKGTYKTPLFAGSVEALIQAALRNVSGLLDSYTWEKKDVYGQWSAYGGKVASMTLEVPASGPAMLTLDWMFKGIASTTGITAGEYPTGLAYKGGANTLTVNSVPYATMETGQIAIANNLQEGPVNGLALEIAFLDEGICDYTGSFKCKFASAAWDAFLRTLTNLDVTAFPAVLTLLNQAGESAKNVSVSFPAGSLKCSNASKEAADQGSVIMQTLEVVHATTGPTWTFPS